MIYYLILLILPVIFLIIYYLKNITCNKIAPTSKKWNHFFLLLVIFVIAFYPIELSNDKDNYLHMYNMAMLYGEDYVFRDIGWTLYNRMCAWVFGNIYELFFLLSATIYVGGIYLYGRKLLSDIYLGYFIVMSAGCIGFSNYGTNVIRAGIGLSVLLLAMSLDKRKIIVLILCLIACSIHKSMIIPVFSFYAAKYVNKTWLFIFFWCLCFTLSVLNVDMGPFFENIGFVDNRVIHYAESIEEERDNYQQGFRIDFVIYSLVPLLGAFYYKFIKRASDAYYERLIRMYLMSNAVWLLAIRMAFTDRLAYLSWFLIPILTLYPVVKYQSRFRSPQHIILLVMTMFMGIRLLLSLRGAL